MDMSIPIGAAASILTWHEVRPAGRDAFLAWHYREHMSDRLELGGFTSARRYAALDPSQGYLCWYSLADRSILENARYRKLNERPPTPAEKAVEAHFVGLSHAISDVVWSIGRGIGGYAAVYRCRVHDAANGEGQARLYAIFEPLVRAGHLQRASLHSVVAHTDLAPHNRAFNTSRPDEILVVEGASDPRVLHSMCTAHLAQGCGRDDGVTLLSVVLYQLQTLLLPDRTNVAETQGVGAHAHVETARSVAAEMGQAMAAEVVCKARQ